MLFNVRYNYKKEITIHTWPNQLLCTAVLGVPVDRSGEGANVGRKEHQCPLRLLQREYRVIAKHIQTVKESQ